LGSRKTSEKSLSDIAGVGVLPSDSRPTKNVSLSLSDLLLSASQKRKKK
jgi:hypothetical protein